MNLAEIADESLSQVGHRFRVVHGLDAGPKLEVEALHELERRAPPRPISRIEYQLAEAVLGAPITRFMVPMRDFQLVAASHDISVLRRCLSLTPRFSGV